MSSYKYLYIFIKISILQVIKSLNNSSDHILAFAGNFCVEADSHLVCIQDTQGNENCYSTHAINIHNKPRKSKFVKISFVYSFSFIVSPLLGDLKIVVFIAILLLTLGIFISRANLDSEIQIVEAVEDFNSSCRVKFYYTRTLISDILRIKEYICFTTNMKGIKLIRISIKILSTSML